MLLIPKRATWIAAATLVAGCTSFDPDPLDPLAELIALDRQGLESFRIERRLPGKEVPDAERLQALAIQRDQLGQGIQGIRFEGGAARHERGGCDPGDSQGNVSHARPP